MNSLSKLQKLLETIFQYASSLPDEPSIKHCMGFFLGEVNLGNITFIQVLDIIKSSDEKNLRRYISSALSFYFHSRILSSQKNIEKHKNDFSCAKQLPNWNDKNALYFDSLISNEQKSIREYNIMLTKNYLNDFVKYFSAVAERNNFYNNYKNCINDMDFIKSNYAYCKILEEVYCFYCFEQSNLQIFRPKENPLYNYFTSRNYDILSDQNYYAYGLITFTTDYEAICTQYVECKLYNKKLGVTIPLIRRMNNTLFSDFITLYAQGVIKKISFRPELETPLQGKDISDMAMEAVDFGMIFDSDFKKLDLTRLSSENKDFLWIKVVGQEITFEELKYDIDTFSEYVMTQAVHLIYFQKDDEYYLL